MYKRGGSKGPTHTRRGFHLSPRLEKKFKSQDLRARCFVNHCSLPESRSAPGLNGFIRIPCAGGLKAVRLALLLLLLSYSNLALGCTESGIARSAPPTVSASPPATHSMPPNGATRCVRKNLPKKIVILAVWLFLGVNKFSSGRSKHARGCTTSASSKKHQILCVLPTRAPFMFACCIHEVLVPRVRHRLW